MRENLLENFAQEIIISPSQPPQRGGERHQNYFLGGNSPPLEGMGEAFALAKRKNLFHP